MSSDNRPNSEDNVLSKAPTRSESQIRSLECDVCSFEDFEYHPEEGVYRAIFDPDVVSPSTAVVGAVSAVADKDPLDIEPLHSTIDPDALNTLVGDRRGSEGDIHARFSIEEYSVTLTSYGCVTVRPSQSDIR